MYTMSGITVSEGVSEGKAFLMLPRSTDEEVDVVRNFSASEESIKYRKASREFASKLNNAMSGTVPDKVRDLFGAVASYITNSGNINAIDEQIAQGHSAYEAARNVLLPKIARFAHEERESESSLGGSAADEEDQEMQVVAAELSSLMRDFIATINISEHSEEDVPRLNVPSVIIANDLTPARFLSLHTELVRAVVLEGGQASGHLGTVLRDLSIPAVYGVKGALTIKDGEHVLVDATRGSILVEPPQDTARALIAQQDLFSDDEQDDGVDSTLQVTVAGSMGAMGEVDRMARYLNHGLGLLRSEFLFLNYHHEPSVEEMVKTFSSIFSNIPKSAPLTARTFDFAGDKKPLFTLAMDEEGSLRSYGAQVGSDLLRKELRALLLASAGREIYIVFPLITRISEAKALNTLLAEVIEELQSENANFGTSHVALMIETPAAVLSAKAFAAYGEMFLIGTSSLAEYASAPRPPEDYFTPALSKMIAIACKGAYDCGVRVGIAGRFAMRTELLPFYLAMGVNYLTTDATSIVKIRKELQYLEDRGVKPHFDRELYNSLMEVASGNDLQRLLLKDDFA